MSIFSYTMVKGGRSGKGSKSRVPYRYYPISRKCEESEELKAQTDEDIYSGVQGSVYEFDQRRLALENDEKVEAKSAAAAATPEREEKVMDFSGTKTVDYSSYEGVGKSDRAFAKPEEGEETVKLAGAKGTEAEFVEAEIVYEPVTESQKLKRAGDMGQMRYEYKDGTVIKIKRKKEEDEDSLFEI